MIQLPSKTTQLFDTLLRVPRTAFVVLTSPLGIDHELLDQCRKSDRAYIVKVALLMWFGWVWQTVLFFSAARIMIPAPDGQWHAVHLLLALLVSTMILLADALIFISSSWTSHGQAILSKTGQFTPQKETGTHVRTAFLIGGRISAVVLVANFFGVIFCLISFPYELSKVTEGWYLQANAALIREKTDGEALELQKLEQRQAELRTSIETLSQQQRRLSAIIVDPQVEEPAMRTAIEGVARAEAAKAEGERALVEAQEESSRQIGGICRGAPCRPGRGPRWRAAQESIAAAQERIAQAIRALVSAQAQLRELQAARAGELSRKTEDAKARLIDVTRSKEAQERQLTTLGDAYQRRLGSRERVIRTAVESDPRHVSREEGLLVRLRALQELMREPAVATLVWIFDGMLVFLEVVTILAKAISLTPLEYVMRLVARDLLLADETARRLAGALGRSAPPAPPEPPAPQPVVPPPVASKANGSTPPGSGPSNPTPRPRHDRWDPPLRSSGSESASDDSRAPSPSNPNAKPSPSSSAA